MKTTAILFWGILSGANLFAQNEVHLKSGEVLNCKVQSLTNGDLVVSFKDNTVHLKIADVAGINFMKPEPKKDTPILPEQQVRVIYAPKPVEVGELKGVVTYYFNGNFGDKPDIGAEVIIYKTDLSDNIIETFASLARAKSAWELYSEYINEGMWANKKDKAKQIEKLKAMNVYPEEKFNQLKDSVRSLIYKLKYRDGSITTTVDGNGNYSVKLPEGYYGIIFISTHISGDVWGETTTVRADESVTESQEFR